MSAWFCRKAVAVSIIGLLASVFAVAANTVAPRAMVDRTIVAEGDSLTLTIRIDDTGSYDAPDLSPLQTDFDLYGTRQSTQHVINNGRVEAHTQWQTTLIPKRSGQLQIPPLSVAGAQTQPITIQVNPQSQAEAIDRAEPVFIEVQTDSSNVYVQQQILLTARVYIAVQLDNMQLTKPGFDNASVEQIAETTFNRTVNGMTYEVHELTYAIFPQQPGELTIPELVFSAVEVTGGRSWFDFPGRGRPLRKLSRQLAVHIKPIPKSFSGSTWLPARNLTLLQSWSGDAQHLAVGDSITRTIEIRADGLLAAQLPRLGEPQLDAAKFYADQSKLDNRLDATGVQGKRTESSVLIPTRAGALQLPETRVVWWDIDSDSEKVATLASETLAIAAATDATHAQEPTPQTAAQSHAILPTEKKEAAPADATRATTRPAIMWWQIATTILALLWLITLLAYWQLRRQPGAAAAVDSAQAAQNISERNAWRDFSAACRANNPAMARQTLLRWAAIFYRASTVPSLEHLQRMASDTPLTRELQLLDNRLFGSLRDSNDWNGENLLQVVQAVKKRGARKDTAAVSALPPLYPAA